MILNRRNQNIYSPSPLMEMFNLFRGNPFGDIRQPRESNYQAF
jgi:hypothetical protein